MDFLTGVGSGYSELDQLHIVLMRVLSTGGLLHQMICDLVLFEIRITRRTSEYSHVTSYSISDDWIDWLLRIITCVLLVCPVKRV